MRSDVLIISTLIMPNVLAKVAVFCENLYKVVDYLYFCGTIYK